jgi:hypothetical protein
MAKQDVKIYVLSRVRTLLRKLADNKNDAELATQTPIRIEEIKNMASNFGIKTKEIEKIESEFDV